MERILHRSENSSHHNKSKEKAINNKTAMLRKTYEKYTLAAQYLPFVQSINLFLSAKTLPLKSLTHMLYLGSIDLFWVKISIILYRYPLKVFNYWLKNSCSNWAVWFLVFLIIRNSIFCTDRNWMMEPPCWWYMISQLWIESAPHAAHVWF